MAGAAKSYSRQKYALSIIDIIYSIALILIFLGSGLSLSLEVFLKSSGLPRYLLSPVFFLAISLLYYLSNLPFNFYSSFILEHRFNLTKQKIGAWQLDQLKGAVLAYTISLILILTFYWVLGRFNQWWLVISEIGRAHV